MGYPGHRRSSERERACLRERLRRLPPVRGRLSGGRDHGQAVASRRRHGAAGRHRAVSRGLGRERTCDRSACVWALRHGVRHGSVGRCNGRGLTVGANGNERRGDKKCSSVLRREVVCRTVTEGSIDGVPAAENAEGGRWVNNLFLMPTKGSTRRWYRGYLMSCLLYTSD